MNTYFLTLKYLIVHFFYICGKVHHSFLCNKFKKFKQEAYYLAVYQYHLISCVFCLPEQLAINELIGNGHRAMALTSSGIKLLNTESTFSDNSNSLKKSLVESYSKCSVERKSYCNILEHEMKMYCVRIEGCLLCMCVCVWVGGRDPSLQPNLQAIHIFHQKYPFSHLRAFTCYEQILQLDSL